ncbi:MAG TPA: hypothetical protein DCX07_02965 [Phycisphaerales bacterium]|nr:hypothetical protein [Phycisphaerales bacterium]
MEMMLEIQRREVESYLFWQAALMFLLIGLFTWGIGIAVGLVYMLTFGPYVARRRAEALDYRLDGTTVRIREGFLFIKHKSIPLDRVTDIVMDQGPLLRHFGLWTLKLQTAGVGQGRAEGVLYGLTEPDRVREMLISARDQAARRGDYAA